ncbi:hypothetical protein H2201_001074 [Coniosporium apollinis]|uniref:Phosphoglycerate mutase n=1 Tax=Coniosporium apollinis TaxID=61459 RepID=A0ABQ9P7H4_9PEZI|nr:hypothetical protein H2201_001074 [Coniosporium apollinis]
MPPTLILIRHAEALHNATHKSRPSPDIPLWYPFTISPTNPLQQNYEIPDPPLTELGEKQCVEMRDHLRQHLPLADVVELIVVSPMRRTLQTMLIGLDWLVERGVNVRPDADWQENSDKPCDTGTPLPTISAEFPTLDFSTVDPLYPAKTTPNNPYAFTRRAVLARGTRALKNLKHRPEKVIAVVSHSGFLRTAVCKTHFANADYRVFEFAGDEEEGEGVKLVEWELTAGKGGGMGRSEKGRADVTESDFPIEKVEEEMGGKVAGEAAREVPKK